MDLEKRWQRIAVGKADEQERIETAWAAGEAKDPGAIPRLWDLLDDEAGQVRYYALQALVIDLNQTDEEAADRCWQLLREDPDKDVRGMAATCLGKIYFASHSHDIFRRFVDELKSTEQPARAKGSIYTALFKIVGRPPSEWPGLHTKTWKAFEESDIDWAKVAELEDSLDSE